MAPPVQDEASLSYHSMAFFLFRLIYSTLNGLSADHYILKTAMIEIMKSTALLTLNNSTNPT